MAFSLGMQVAIHPHTHRYLTVTRWFSHPSLNTENDAEGILISYPCKCNTWIYNFFFLLINISFFSCSMSTFAVIFRCIEDFFQATRPGISTVCETPFNDQVKAPQMSWWHNGLTRAYASCPIQGEVVHGRPTLDWAKAVAS